VTIEGNRWIGYSEALTAGLSFTTAINTWVSQVPPQPAVDADGYGMLNTAVWLPTSFGLRQTIPNGTYQVFFWLLENHQSNFRSFDVRLEGATAAQGIGTLPYGTWSKYGPYSVTVGDGVLSIDLVRNFGDPHLMGLVIQSGGSGGTTTPPPVADPALVLHWRLDETAGTSASDASGNGNAGTLSPQGPVWTDGRIAGGLDFGGGGDRVTAPSSATLNSLKGQMTASLWVYKRSDAPTWGILAGRRYGSGWEDLWNVYYTNSASDEYGFGLRTSAGPAVLTGPSSTADRNLWVHLAAVYDGSRMLLYRNGQEIARRSHTGTIPDEAAPLLVAAGDNGTYGIGEYVDAILDDLRIYNRALSASEIQALAGSSFAMSSQASDADAGVVAAEPSGSEGREGTCGLVGAELLFALAVGAFRPRRRR